MSTSSNAYGAGIMAKTGKAFADEYFAEENQVVHESHEVVLVLKKSDEMNSVVEEILLGDRKADNPTLVVEDRAGYWWLKATGKIEVDCTEVSELLGKNFSVYDFLVDVSSTIGRAYTLGETFTITSELMGLDVKLKDLEKA
ncbi:MAG: MmoB/DmpM family protein [Methylococcaceae bacterium]|nr:MmoB/DmpM family protein [Methylococcaceae bacterium]MDZ4156914.1 MmoB/DmpM family protein [Methylococcales bacterium]MDP2394038.1 MmoB/DmpM family protein [Methylococcaceae bacterium]MDP3018498.1 MmoB/DmpM family protein [Methylococcaceae bacterium]MDP3390976.1 MmoB/DmpM family protein [Methylococcaceae bacterium]